MGTAPGRLAARSGGRRRSPTARRARRGVTRRCRPVVPLGPGSGPGRRGGGERPRGGRDAAVHLLHQRQPRDAGDGVRDRVGVRAAPRAWP